MHTRQRALKRAVVKGGGGGGGSDIFVTVSPHFVSLHFASLHSTIFYTCEQLVVLGIISVMVTVHETVTLRACTVDPCSPVVRTWAYSFSRSSFFARLSLLVSDSLTRFKTRSLLAEDVSQHNARQSSLAR